VPRADKLWPDSDIPAKTSLRKNAKSMLGCITSARKICSP